ncbi:MAG: NifB/NifX family molybdenum-iron cluster-binding protein [Planctomycetota bacterium]|jgi:predicted Fe-Mo cluster-binding NifX family protein
MKISVSARGESLDSEVDPRFGRTAGFVLFDSESGSAEYLDNSAEQDSAKGTGVKAAQLIAKAGAQALITGQLGPNAAQFLRKSGIKIYACSSGTVREAIQMLQENGLEELGDDDIDPGPGKMGGRGMGGGGRGRGPSQGGRGKGGAGRGRGPGAGGRGQGG